MARDRETTPTVDEPTPLPGSLAPVPSSEDVCRVVAAWAMTHRRAAVECEIVVRHVDGSGRKLTDTLAVPLDLGISDELTDRIVAVLSKLTPGQWLGGKAMAAECGVEDAGSGYFRRAIGALKSGGKIESNQNLGYRLARG